MEEKTPDALEMAAQAHEERTRPSSRKSRGIILFCF